MAYDTSMKIIILAHVSNNNNKNINELLNKFRAE